MGSALSESEEFPLPAPNGTDAKRTMAEEHAM